MGAMLASLTLSEMGEGILPGRRAWQGYEVQWDSGCSRSECWEAASWASAAPGSVGKGWSEIKWAEGRCGKTEGA